MRKINMKGKRGNTKKRGVKTIIVAMLACVLLGQNGSNVALAYDQSDAVDYAKKWWNSYNTSEYDKFSSDCTNYASQCLIAGGFSMKNFPSSDISYGDLGTIKTTKKYFGAKKYTKKFAGIIEDTDYVTSSTFANVDQQASSSFYGLQDYLNIKKGKTLDIIVINKTNIKALVKIAQKGDIIQIAKRGKRCSHSYVVGSVKMDSAKNRKDIYVYAHSDARGASSDDCLLRMYEAGTFDDFFSMVLIEVKNR